MATDALKTSKRSFDPKRRLPTAEDANHQGTIFARKHGRIGFDGVHWNEVVSHPDMYAEWRRVKP